MKKAPAFPVYTKDFDTDEAVQLMELDEEGAYLRLLRHQWREGSIPEDHRALAKILRVPPARVAKLWKAIGPCFLAHPTEPGRLINAKTERVRADQAAYLAKKSKAGKDGNRLRWECDQGASRKTVAPSTIADASPSVAVAVSASVAVPEQSYVPSKEQATECERQDYAHEVWAAFCAKVGYPVTRPMNSLDWNPVKAWMDDGIPLRVVLTAIREANGKGTTLAYYKAPVKEAHERWRQALQVAQ